MAGKGYIHSLESFGTVDGPGVRLIVFFQGCPLRCLYCHNPDTWEMNTGNQMTVDEIVAAYLKNKDFYKNGGVTASGGEPLMQIDFLIELFEALKKYDVHTTLDTSGITFKNTDITLAAKFDRLMQVTDLVMLDIKHTDVTKHKELTDQYPINILGFADYLARKRIPLWVRHVVVPGITDDPGHLFDLGYYIGGLVNLKSLDLLPYHSMGKSKYRQLGLEYPLKDTPDMDKEKTRELRARVLEGLAQRRKEIKEGTSTPNGL